MANDETTPGNGDPDRLDEPGDTHNNSSTMDEHSEGNGTKKSRIVIKFSKPEHGPAKIHVATLHKRLFGLLQDADENLEFVVNSSDDTIVINIPEDFPTKGDDYRSTFTVTQAKADQIVVSHDIYSSKTVEDMKYKNQELLLFLKTNRIWLDTSFSGSSDERSIGIFFGVHPEKVSRQLFMKDFATAVEHMDCTAQETDMFKQAHTDLPFNGPTPPFKFRVGPIVRNRNGVEYSAKVLHFHCASEHSKFWRSFLIRAKADHLISGLGNFFAFQGKDSGTILLNAIQWHNRTIEHQVVLPILGISRLAMDATVTISHANATHQSTIRKTLLDSGHFKTIHSTRQTETTGKWMFTTTKESLTSARTFIDEHIIPIFHSSEIEASALVKEHPIPFIPAATETVRARNQHRQHQSWSAIVGMDSESVLTENSAYSTSKDFRKPGTKVEFVFDAEDIADFPPLPHMAGAPKINHDNSSTASATSDASSVTREELQQLRDELKQECASLHSSLSGITGTSSDTLTTLREEMRQDRESHSQLMREQMQQQMDAWNSQSQLMMMTIQAMLANNSIATHPNLNQPITPPNQHAPPQPSTNLPLAQTQESITNSQPTVLDDNTSDDQDSEKRSFEDCETGASPEHKLAKVFGSHRRRKGLNATKLYDQQSDLDEDHDSDAESTDSMQGISTSQVASPIRAGGKE